MAKIAVLAGATGLVGSYLLRILLEDPEYSVVKVIGRRSTGIQNAKLEEILIDMDRLPDISDKLQSDVVFCCLGTTMKKAGSREAFRKVDLEYPLLLGKICREQGAGTYVQNSALGASADSSIFYNKVKGEAEEAIGKLNFRRYGIVRPSLLLGSREEFRGGELAGKIFAKLCSPLFVGKLKRYKPVHAKDVAVAMQKLGSGTEEGKVVVESEDISGIS